MDGFDLGIGILFPPSRCGDERDQAMNSIAPVWDGNETWLVLGGGGLLAAFPLAYAIILPATLPADHRHAARPGLPRRRVRVPLARPATRRAVGRRLLRCGSLVAALRAGHDARRASSRASMSTGRAYAGGWWDWLTPFSLLTGVAVVVGYALLGATWLS